MLHRDKAKTPEKTGHISEHKNLFEAQRTGFLQKLLYQGGPHPLAARVRKHCQRAYLRKILPIDVQPAATEDRAVVRAADGHAVVSKILVKLQVGFGQHELPVRVIVDDAMHRIHVRESGLAHTDRSRGTNLFFSCHDRFNHVSRSKNLATNYTA